MTRKVNIEDLIDANEIAEMLGLAQRNAVSLYQRRYPEMPRPVISIGGGRTRLWLRPEIERWMTARRSRLQGKRKK